MKRPILTLFSVVAILSIGTFVFFDRTLAARFIEQRLVQSATRHGIRLGFTQSDLGLVGLSAEQLDIFMPRHFLQLQLDSPSLSVSGLDLLRLRYGGSLHADFYEGALHIHPSRSIWNDDVELRASLQNSKLRNQPQLVALGLTGGSLSFDLPSLVIKGGNSLDGQLTAQVVGVNKPAETVLSPLITGLPLEVRIPPFSDLKLELLLRARGTELFFERLMLESSLLSGTLRGSMQLDKSLRVDSVDLHGSMNLSDQGQQVLGPYLPFLGPQINSESSEFELSVTGPIRRPEWKIRSTR